MVMANPPAGELDAESAQHVGREFVRQYYTLMHEAPYHLHRFYSQNSSFVHGGVEKPGEEQPPVVGQHEIHKKIISLGYRDCHAKIRQVDSQPTVGNAVVVQVTGELSNDGKPMRRFMQTFVLAPQSAKQYYVHNDVFRYQDEVFVDEEEDADAEETEGFSEVVENGSPTESPQQPQEPLFFEQPVQPMSNGSVQDEEEEVATVEKSKAPEEAELEAEIDSLDIEESQQTFDKAEPTPVVEPPAEPEPEPQPTAPKPCSWAALVRAPNSASASQSTPTFGTVGKPSRPAEPKTETGPAPSNSSTASPGGNQPQPQRAPRPPRERFERDRSNMSRGEEGDVDSLSGRRPAGGGVGNKYPDNQQLFVGNLPHNISERELKVFFEHWGKVVELRINTKASGGKLPNFGFVVFDSPEPVQDILKQKPIKFNGEHRLNVEEKKPRGSEGRPSGRGAPRGGGPGGPRGGYSGGRGGGIKTGGGFGRPNDGERRGMGVGGGAPRGGGGMSGPPRR